MTFRLLFNQYALLWAMLIGVLGYKWLHHLSPILPVLLFIMLLFSYTKVSPRDLKPKKIHYALLLVQWSMGILLYILLAPWSPFLAQGLALLILTPTAISAPVVTTMLGGSGGFIVSYLIPSNLLIVTFGPLLIGWLYPDVIEGSYLTTVWNILSQVTTLLILPLTIVWFLRYFAPKVHNVMYDHAKVSFYAWVILVAVVMGTSTYRFINDEQLEFGTLVILSVSTLLLALWLFATGGFFSKDIKK